MLFIQVFVYILLTLPAGAEAFYLILTLGSQHINDTDLQLAIGRFIFAFTTVVSYMGVSLPFYLYTLTGSTFREILIKIITKSKFCQNRH